jgi:hypothetical protein
MRRNGGITHIVKTITIHLPIKQDRTLAMAEMAMLRGTWDEQIAVTLATQPGGNSSTMAPSTQSSTNASLPPLCIPQACHGVDSSELGTDEYVTTHIPRAQHTLLQLPGELLNPIYEFALTSDAPLSSSSVAQSMDHENLTFDGLKYLADLETTTNSNLFPASYTPRRPV